MADPTPTPPTKPTDAGSWLVFFVAGQRYALPVNNIEELMYADTVETSTMPQRTAAVQGVMRWRNRVVSLLDLRTVFKITPMLEQTQELLNMLIQREEDHVKWIHELESSVREDREFKLATNPHKCGFGKWYDAIRQNKEDLAGFTNHHSGLLRVLHAFDEPHQKIHALAKKVAELRIAGNADGALALIDQTRNTTLHQMVQLFDEARKLIQQLHRAMIVVLHQGGTWIAIMIDSIDRIAGLVDEDVCFEDVQGTTGPIAFNAARPTDREELVLRLPLDSLIRECGQAPAQDDGAAAKAA